MPSKGTPCAKPGFIGFTPVQGGVIPLPFTSMPGYWKNELEGVMSEIDNFRCDRSAPASAPVCTRLCTPPLCAALYPSAPSEPRSEPAAPRCRANVPYEPDDFRPGMCGWRCSFMGETNCIPRCVMQYTCCSLYK